VPGDWIGFQILQLLKFLQKPNGNITCFGQSKLLPNTYSRTAVELIDFVKSAFQA
jgi:hypothetical protein